MPYNPGISYVGDRYIADAIGSLGEDAAKVIEERRKQDQLDAYNDTVVKNALQNSDISLDDYNKYSQMSGKQKTGFAAGLAANVHDKWQRSQQQSEIDLRNAHMEQMRNAIAQQKWQPSWEDRQQAYSVGGDYIPTQQGYQFKPYPDDGSKSKPGDFKVEPYVDPNTGKAVDGIGIVHGPGNQFQVVQRPSGGAVVETDPATGVPFYRDKSGNPHPLNAQQIMAGQLGNAAGGAKPQSPTASPEMIALAQKALSDPGATPEQKAAARRILGQQQ